jgi:hypothetical protein
VTVKESAWTEQDRAEMIALKIYQDSFCPCGCGQKSEDSLSDEVSGPGFRAKRIACRARMAIIDAQEEAAKTTSPYAGARLWTVDKIGR